MEILLVLGFPLLGAALLAMVGAKHYAAEINVATSLATLLAAALLVLRIIRHGPMTAWNEEFFIDPLNVFLVALTALVGFTTSVFSRPYMRIEANQGRLTPGRLRLYHSMYQLFMAAMLLALTTNNMGFMWVAMEMATLSTVLLVSLYRTRGSIEA
ncbi:MAG: hydrogenase 4 subunit F, partial [Pseudomonadota bacterium]|nr:hydrogenase 4 subunit F [Pseudomonadota bacterium]